MFDFGYYMNKVQWLQVEEATEVTQLVTNGR